MWKESNSKTFKLEIDFQKYVIYEYFSNYNVIIAQIRHNNTLNKVKNGTFFVKKF